MIAPKGEREATPLCYASSERIERMNVTWAKLFRGLALAALLTGGAARIGMAQEAAPVVVSIRIVHKDGSLLKDAPAGLPVEAGKPLDRGQVAASLRILYKTGNYANLKAVTTPAEGGVRLDFVAEENLYFNQVILRGLTEPPSEASAAAAMQIQLGDVYRREKLDTAIERLKGILQDEGLYQAKVSTEIQANEGTHQADVIVNVTPGARARVSAVQLTNNTEYPNEQIASRLKMKTGTAITNARIQKGTANIRKFLTKKGHLSGRAAVRRGEYDAAKNTVPLTLDVTEGPRVKVEVTGTKISGGELKRLLPIYQEGAVDADLLEEGKKNIRERLERQGYFDATVDYTTATRDVKEKGNGWQGTEELITYMVGRGERHKLIGIDITGNKYFDEELLRSRLSVYQGALGSRGKFSRRLLEADRVSMEGLYKTNGFLDAKVEADIQDNYHEKGGDLYVKFVINEGVQTRVASLKIEGNRAFSEDELQGVVGSLPGQPYSEASVGSDRANILALYYNEGYPEATLRTSSEDIDASKDNAAAQTAAEKRKGKKPAEFKEVKVTYRIEEGPQTRVRKVLVSGYNHTRPGIIRRQIQVKENAPLRQGEVVDSQRRLYNLGIFNRATIAPQNPNGSDPDKDVVALVEEAKRYTLAYGGGFEVQRLASSTNPTGSAVEAAPRGILEISKLNLTGRADSLSLKLRGSTLQGRALLGYSSPNTFASPNFSFQATAYAEKTRDISTFNETRYEGSVQLTQQVSPRTTLLYRYSFRKILVSDLKILPEEIPLFQQPTLVSQFGISWVRDTRDNPADASKGTLNSADFGIADTGLGSSASFTRFLYQNSSYYPIKRRFSFARSIRIGVLNPYRDTVSLTFPPPTGSNLPQVIPLPERFFAGGGTSLRGFALNQAGPRDSNSGFPVGGQAMLVLNQEFRFPMRLPYFGTSLGGAIFYDGGNVYSRVTRISFRYSLPKPTFDNSATPQCLTNCSNELNYFSHTVGLGLRYATPVGPIRVDLGYQLNRPFFVLPIPCPNGATSCTTGSLGFQGGQLPRFQISFNLGASF
ncbi:MAG: BamA/TamA family outer membrane protein [Acidobacteria bacterium]|nr:BamA/TamA family outer membrane protein [Acidobacteriota bacterium]MBS1864460.1 BamA/TamA family outer membrane protein [Acidobacteriota bacterium]